MTENTPAEDSLGEFIVYRTTDGSTEVQLRAVNGTVWLTQAQMADLYGTSIPNINQLITRVLADGEATEATIKPELIVRLEGERQVSRSAKAKQVAHCRFAEYDRNRKAAELDAADDEAVAELESLAKKHDGKEKGGE